MAVSSYTTYDAVRLALGVSDDEIDDDTLEVETVVFELEEQLLSIGPTLIDDYAAVAEMEDEALTSDQRTLYRRVRLFSAAAVALRVSTGLPLMAPKDITDGKAAISRYPGTPYADVIARIQKDYELAYQRLSNTVNGGDDLETVFPQSMVFSVLNRDPVVSE